MKKNLFTRLATSLLVLSYLLLNFQTQVFAQNFTVTGKVTDATTKEGIPGANVIIKGTVSGATTDFDGHYTISITDKENTVFQVSYIGYNQIEVPVNSKTIVNIELKSSVESLGEVVVMGYGSQNKKEISGSVSNVTAKDFNKGVSRDAVDLLQGKVAGLTITQAGGDVTENSSIRLRGTSSLKGGTAPFIVIDGVPGGDLSSVSPQDIESISILKDAASAAIYGSRSASGVILVTTKKGREGKTSLTYDGYAALDFVSNKPKMLNGDEWRALNKELGHDISIYDKGANTDWFDEILRTGVSHNHSVSLSGGGKNSNYRASISYLNREGVVESNNSERINSRFSISQKAIQDKLNITFMGAATKVDYSPADERNFTLAYNRIPVLPVKTPDGDWDETFLGEFDQGNPAHNIALNSFDNKRIFYQGNINATFDILPNLIAGTNIDYTRASWDYSEYLNSETEKGFNNKGFGKRESSTRDKNLIELTLNYNKSFNEHKFDILAGYSWEEINFQKFKAQNRGFLSDYTGANDLTAGSNLRYNDVKSEKDMTRLISFFGRVNYSYKERYMATLIARNDGSSKFGKNHKWGFFPSASVAWRISEEAFMKDKSVFTDLKLRVGYGVTGNQDGLDPYKSLSIYKQDGFYFDNGSWYPSYKISQNANADLKWEQTSMLNIGLDFELLKGRISGSVEWYNKKTSDMLYEYKVPTPPFFHGTMMANVGEMSNKGLEFYINAYPIQGELTWNISLNLAHNKNEITKLSNDKYTTERVYTGNPSIRGGSNTTIQVIEEGRPVGTFFGWKAKGIENGKYIFEDIDGEPGITETDRTYIGDANPDFTYGINNSFTYKNFDFSFFLRGVVGNDILNSSRMQYASTAWLPGSNVLRESKTLGLNETPIYSSFYIEKGTFLRLDNLSLGYTINTDKINWLERCRIYFTAQNLFVITGYKGLDPEVAIDRKYKKEEDTTDEPGVESKEFYPRARTFSIGLSLSF